MLSIRLCEEQSMSWRWSYRHRGLDFYWKKIWAVGSLLSIILILIIFPGFGMLLFWLHYGPFCLFNPLFKISVGVLTIYQESSTRLSIFFSLPTIIWLIKATGSRCPLTGTIVYSFLMKHTTWWVNKLEICTCEAWLFCHQTTIDVLPVFFFDSLLSCFRA